MKIAEVKRALIGATAITGVLGAFASPQALAKNWQTEFATSLTAINPVNDYLVTGEFSVIASRVASRGEFNANYSLSFDSYMDTSEASGYRHSLIASAKTEWIPEHFTVDFSAGIDEINSDADDLGPAFSRTNTAGNRVRVMRVSARPKLQFYPTSNVIGYIGGVIGYVDYSDPDVPSTVPVASQYESQQNTRVNAGIGNLEDEAAPVRWQLNGELSVDDAEYERSEILASVFWDITPHWALIGRVGEEKVVDLSLDDQGTFWRVGLEMTGVERTYFRAEAGDRFGRTTYDANFSHQFIGGFSVEFQYVEQRKTVTERWMDGLASVEYDDEGLAIVVGEGELELLSGVYVEQNARLMLSFADEDSVVRFTGGFKTREFDASGYEEEVYSLNGIYTERLTERVSFQAGFWLSEEETKNYNPAFPQHVLNITYDTEARRAGVGLAYDLSETTRLTWEVARRWQENLANGRVEENAILLQITRVW